MPEAWNCWKEKIRRNIEMKATLVSKEKGEAIFTIEFSAEEFNDATVKAYR